MDLIFIVVEVVIVIPDPNVFRIYRGVVRRARIFRRCAVAAEFDAADCGLYETIEEKFMISLKTEK